MELLCIVHASPKAKVNWYKDGRRLNESGSDTRVSIGHTGRKHLLTISLVEESDRGRYTCHAINSLGESKGNIQVMGRR